MADTIPFSPPDIGEAEIDAVARVMRSGWITTGPETAKFETEISAYTGAGGTAAVNSATAALELILRCLGVGPGDEVITSAYTYSASASAIAHVGAVRYSSTPRPARTPSTPSRSIARSPTAPKR